MLKIVSYFIHYRYYFLTKKLVLKIILFVMIFKVLTHIKQSTIKKTNINTLFKSSVFLEHK